MPRKAPDNVTEHRITFGNLERDFLDQQLKQDRTNSIIKGVASVGPSLGLVVIGGGIALGAYAAYQWVIGAVPTLNPINNLFGIKDRFHNITKNEQDAFDAKNVDLAKQIKMQEGMVASGTLTESQLALVTKNLNDNYEKRNTLLEAHTEYQQLMSVEGVQEKLGTNPAADFLIGLLLG